MMQQPSGAVAPALNKRTWLVFFGALALYLVSSGFKDTAYNNYTLLAQAWLHGQLWLDGPIPGIDALQYGGHWYIIEAPLPAVFMLPLVTLFGVHANQVVVGAMCAAISVATADVLFLRMGLTARQRSWLTAFVAVGTVLWWCTAFGAVWMFAHVSGFMFALLALVECYGHRRPWLVGLLCACAALCRFPMVVAILPFMLWLYLSKEDRDYRVLTSFALGFVPLFLIYVAYNYARWHTLGDIGYTLWYHQDQVGEATGSPFRLRYLPFNLYSFLFMPPEWMAHFPWLKPTSFGIALTFTSPALLLAFLAPARRRETLLWWAAVVLTAGPSLLYYVNGFEQFGMRHSLDFEAFALPLVARGLQRSQGAVWYGLIIFSILANAYGIWYSWAYHGFTVVPR
ncbi:MAG: hypothetical protein M3Z37_02235 [Candidatus Eremiobacteraeota bacterium]|nr:hypothetical protein [Candidatus Eremiobacteraeota bacterium]